MKGGDTLCVADIQDIMAKDMDMAVPAVVVEFLISVRFSGARNASSRCWNRFCTEQTKQNRKTRYHYSS